MVGMRIGGGKGLKGKGLDGQGDGRDKKDGRGNTV